MRDPSSTGTFPALSNPRPLADDDARSAAAFGDALADILASERRAAPVKGRRPRGRA